MEGVIDFNGAELSTIPVINRPSYFLVNNYGREQYMTILEPVDDFKATPERKVLAGAYKNLTQLTAAFKEKAPVGSTDSGYNRKDVVEIFFMGFMWRWRPNHKSFYGSITVGYELLPLIARWIVLTGAMDKIDNHNPAYLPIKYKDGTGKGFGGVDAEAPRVDASKMAIEKHVADVQQHVVDANIRPIPHTMKNSVQRAALMNTIPKEAVELYDELMDGIMKLGLTTVSSNGRFKYVMTCSSPAKVDIYIGAVFGGKNKIPNWASAFASKDGKTLRVTAISINARNIEEAESLMQALIAGT